MYPFWRKIMRKHFIYLQFANVWTNLTMQKYKAVSFQYPFMVSVKRVWCSLYRFTCDQFPNMIHSCISSLSNSNRTAPTVQQSYPASMHHSHHVPTYTMLKFMHRMPNRCYNVRNPMMPNKTKKVNAENAHHNIGLMFL